jgi:NCS1 family nucleobase:cation symporter-1
MVLFSLLSVMTTSATAVIFGSVIWDPVALSTKLPDGPWSTIVLLGIVLATLSVNVPANLVSASYDMCNLSPRHISLWRGALLAAAIGTLIMPWRLLSSADVFIFDWLGNCAIFLAPIAGILISDYWLVRRRTLVVDDLYRNEGAYRYAGGINPKAYIATACGIALAYSGKFIPALHFLFEISWITAFASALIIYRLLMKPYHGY